MFYPSPQTTGPPIFGMVYFTWGYIASFDGTHSRITSKAHHSALSVLLGPSYCPALVEHSSNLLILSFPSCKEVLPYLATATIKLPTIVQYLLPNTAKQTIPAPTTPDIPCGSLIVANSGTTDHMIPDSTAFISYRLTKNLRV